MFTRRSISRSRYLSLSLLPASLLRHTFLSAASHALFLSPCSFPPAPTPPSHLQKAKKPAAHLTGLAKIQHDESYLTTGKEFEKLHGKTAKKQDTQIAKQAGLKDMGWMGSKSYIDNKLKVPFSPCVLVSAFFCSWLNPTR